MHEVLDFFTELSEREQAVPYHYALRVSSFPFCARGYVIIRLLPYQISKSDTYMMDFYADIGKHQHSALQRWLAPVLFGDWECWNKECKEKVFNSLGPQRCPTHGPMEYVEFTLEYRGVTGHCDGILLPLGDVSQPLVGKLRRVYDKLKLPYHTPMPLEAKTRSSGDINARVEPDWVHYLQVNTYACMIPFCVPAFKDMQCPYALLHYISRANHRVFTSFVRKVNPIAFESLFQEISQARGYVDQKLLPTGICTSLNGEDARTCPLRGICFSPSLVKELGVQEV